MHPQPDRRLMATLYVATVTTGCVDAASYLGLGQVFTANMTGNVVLLGFGIGGAGDLPIVAPLISLARFLAGAAIAGRMVSALADREPALYRAALGSEVLLVGSAAVVAAVATIETDSWGAYATIVLLACAMGLRTAVVRSLGIPDLRTTVLTLTLTGLAAESRVGGGTGERSAVRLGAAVALFGGALIGALLEREALALPLVFAAGCGLLTLALYSPRPR